MQFSCEKHEVYFYIFNCDQRLITLMHTCALMRKRYQFSLFYNLFYNFKITIHRWAMSLEVWNLSHSHSHIHISNWILKFLPSLSRYQNSRENIFEAKNNDMKSLRSVQWNA